MQPMLRRSLPLLLVLVLGSATLTSAPVCAAEPRLSWSPRMLLRLAGEAGYVCLTDLGTRWARLVRNARMLERVT